MVNHGNMGKEMSRKDENRPHGPGNTFWYVDSDGEIIRCRWNDSGWCNRTFFNIREEKKYSSEYEYLKLINDAYKQGMEDQLKLIQNMLGIQSK